MINSDKQMDHLMQAEAYLTAHRLLQVDYALWLRVNWNTRINLTRACNYYVSVALQIYFVYHISYSVL